MVRDKIASFRLTDAEHEALTALAEKQDTTLTDLTRGAALALLAPAPAPVLSGSRTVAAHACVIWAAPDA